MLVGMAPNENKNSDGHETTRRDASEAVFHPVDLLFPDRLPEPDSELFDRQPAPARGEEVAQLVDNDK